MHDLQTDQNHQRVERIVRRSARPHHQLDSRGSRMKKLLLIGMMFAIQAQAAPATYTAAQIAKATSILAADVESKKWCAANTDSRSCAQQNWCVTHAADKSCAPLTMLSLLADSKFANFATPNLPAPAPAPVRSTHRVVIMHHTSTGHLANYDACIQWLQQNGIMSAASRCQKLNR